jgi:hypothetical protein
MYRRIITLALCSSLAACAAARTQTSSQLLIVSPVEGAAWRSSIRSEDEGKLRELPVAWSALHAKLPPRVRTAQGTLVNPGAATDLPTLTPGSYRCRALKLRTQRRGAVARSSASDFCFVSGATDGFSFVKQTGAEPMAGYFYPDGKRYVFLGARQRRAGDNSLGYGNDPARDMVGVVERVGGFRWRLAIAGTDTRQLDIYELTPVPVEQQPKG